MYQPAHQKFVETRPEALHALIRDYPLGTVITRRGEDLLVNHTPFILDAVGKTLTAHFPRANSVWEDLEGQSVVVVFQGPNAYISPSWYAAKKVHGKVVPTWNYVIVHARGVARVIQDNVWLRNHLEALTDKHERDLPEPWKVSDAPGEYTSKLIEHIVGIEISVAAIEGKFKLGQNRPEEDRRRVAQELRSAGSGLAEFAEKVAE